VHTFERPIAADAVRVRIEATNGAERANVVAVRVFADERPGG
jgi:hypothetical protein